MNPFKDLINDVLEPFRRPARWVRVYYRRGKLHLKLWFRHAKEKYYTETLGLIRWIRETDLRPILLQRLTEIAGLVFGMGLLYGLYRFVLLIWELLTRWGAVAAIRADLMGLAITTLTLIVGCGLYRLRVRSLITYGRLEIAFALLVCYASTEKALLSLKGSPVILCRTVKKTVGHHRRANNSVPAASGRFRFFTEKRT